MEVWQHLPQDVQQAIIDKQIKLYAIDASAVAKETQPSNRINTIMQTCFFAISGVLPQADAIEKIKQSIRKTYGKRGEPVVRQNFAAVDTAIKYLHQIPVPAEATTTVESTSEFAANVPKFVQQVTAEIIAGRGDQLPVSAFPLDGTYPVGTAQFEKRNIALEVPVWEEDLVHRVRQVCSVFAHIPAIRAKVCDQPDLA